MLLVSVLALYIIGLAAGMSGCGRTTATLEGVARDYLRLAVALGERDPDALDFYSGPPEWVAAIRTQPPPLTQIKIQAVELTQTLEYLRLPESQNARRNFLRGQLQAIAARCDLLLGITHSFDEEAELLFGIHLTQDGPDPEAIRASLQSLLPGKGDLASRYTAFDEKHLISPGRAPAVLGRALEACREQTLAHWRLPTGETVTLEYVHEKPWSAYSTYNGNYHSTIRVNLDYGLTVHRALQLACHEGYPGHHAFNVMADERLVHGQKLAEFSAQTTFSPQSLVSEAAASAAPGLAFSSSERARIEHELFRLAGLHDDDAELDLWVEERIDGLRPAELAVARDYLDGRLEFVRAAAALKDRALMAHSVATLLYLNEYRTYVVAYTEGRSQVERWLAQYEAEQSGADRRWEALRSLVGTAALPSSGKGGD